MVSPQFIKQVVEACGSCEELCYATALSATMGYFRGQLRYPTNIPQDKLSSVVKDLRKTELQLLQASGFSARLVTKTTPKEQKPKCFEIL